jgi:hydroxymethylbilane synthase
MTVVRIGTRGSALALWQAEHIKARLVAAEPGLVVELVVIKTQGDKITDVPLAQAGGKGLFVKEIEERLAAGDVDLAVHSLKDLPTEILAGLTIAAVSSREDPRDAIVSASGGLDALPEGARVGTSSLRRMCQLRAARPDLRLESLRGNVDTRLAKLDAGEVDAIVLAVAGLLRLGRADRIAERLAPSRCLPAVGQGVLAIETRTGDDATMARVRRAIHDEDTARCVAAERAFLARLEGGCQTPIACHAVLAGGVLEVDGLVGSPDGSLIVRAEASGKPGAAEVVGRTLAEALLAGGAAGILEQARQ